MGKDTGLNTILAFLIILIVVWGLWYFFIFENFLAVTSQIGYNFYPVESELWWMIVGFILLSSLAGSIKIFEYSRRGNSTSS